MKLLTQADRRRLPALYSTERLALEEHIAQVKFFDPTSGWTWYAVEAGEVDGTLLFFGLVEGHEREWGYFSLAELTAIRGRFGLPIERDLHFRPTAIKDLG